MPPVAKSQPPHLERLLARIDGKIADLTTQLEQGSLTVAQWQAQVGREIKVHSAAAYMQGAHKRLLSKAEQRTVGNQVATQLSYLDAWAGELASADEMPGNLMSRAAMYGNSIKQPYWQGSIGNLPLPALPGDGSTQCLTNCKCLWSLDELDAESNNWDATWIRGATDSCRTCVDRAQAWAPLRIRHGEVS